MNNTSKNNPCRFLKDDTCITKKFYSLHKNHKYTQVDAAATQTKMTISSDTRLFKYEVLQQPYHILLPSHPQYACFRMTKTFAKTKKFNMKDCKSIVFFLNKASGKLYTQCSVYRLFSPNCTIRQGFISVCFFMTQNKTKNDVTCIQLL